MTQVALHSSVVGGSTASRVIACPASVALVNQMTPKPSSKYADEGTLLHDVMSEYLSKDYIPIQSFVGTKYKDITLTMEHLEEKLLPALAALEQKIGRAHV